MLGGCQCACIATVNCKRNAVALPGCNGSERLRGAAVCPRGGGSLLTTVVLAALACTCSIYVPRYCCKFGINHLHLQRVVQVVGRGVVKHPRRQMVPRLRHLQVLRLRHLRLLLVVLRLLGKHLLLQT
jgi:hypothetical protein